MGAICDVTGLTGFNRALTGLGLRVMSDWKNPGLKALLAAAKAEEGPAKSNHAGFILGPRINAGGRIGKSDLGARLLSTDDPEEAPAGRGAGRPEHRPPRDRASGHRRGHAPGRADGNAHTDGSAVVVIAGDDWHPGVVGIVAGRLRERWRKPVIVIGVDAVNGHRQGLRPVPAGHEPGPRDPGRLERGPADRRRRPRHGGGLTVKTDGIDVARLPQRPAGRRTGRGRDHRPGRDRRADRARRRHRALFEMFEQLAPFGPANPEPLFALAQVQAREPVAMNGGHVRCRLVGADGASVKAIAWRCADLPLGKALLAGQGG
jgi:single-stranded-DNA-specific exonuclease